MAIALVAALAAGCAPAVALPRLRARGWLTQRDAGRLEVGGELGLVMPLGAPTPSATEPDAEPPSVVIPAGRASRCRVRALCAWEELERARALARHRNGGAR